MADNKKYYYLKLKDNFFETDEMIILESMPEGIKYSNILLKLYLKSLKNEGRLMFNERIPYNSQILATLTRNSVGDIEKAMEIFKNLGLIEVLDNGAIYMLDIQNFIGRSTTEADRKREYRNKIDYEKHNSTQMSGQMSGQIEDKTTPEIEIELEIEKKINNTSSKDDGEFDLFWNIYNKKVEKHKCKLKWNRLPKADKKEIFNTVKKYVESTPDKQYRKNPLSYLNGRVWEDEIETYDKELKTTVKDIQPKGPSRKIFIGMVNGVAVYE